MAIFESLRKGKVTLRVMEAESDGLKAEGRGRYRLMSTKTPYDSTVASSVDLNCIRRAWYFTSHATFCESLARVRRTIWSELRRSCTILQHHRSIDDANFLANFGREVPGFN
ncbi:hypothetical protein CKO36_06860 [Rhabdochromatium marinum]|nr:hypothetical protein [Rhabdochromatium marinum]